MYQKDFKYFSNNYSYNFDLISENFGFFETKKIIQNKIDELSVNCLVYFEGNKLLSVEIDDHEKYWLFYEKAKFFFKLFNINNKFVLINENDEFFYGYIDGFPCVFQKNYDMAKHAMQDYANGEFVMVFGVGKVERKCHKIKSYNEIIDITKVENNEKIDYLEENSDLYDSQKPDFDIFIINYLAKNYILDYKRYFTENIIMILLFLFFSIIDVFLFFIN